MNRTISMQLMCEYFNRFYICNLDINHSIWPAKTQKKNVGTSKLDLLPIDLNQYIEKYICKIVKKLFFLIKINQFPDFMDLSSDFYILACNNLN